MSYESVNDRNEDLRYTYNIHPVGASEVSFCGQPVHTSIRGFKVYFWGDEWHTWKREDNKFARLNKLLDALVEQERYIIESIEIQENVVLIHRGGHLTDVFVMADGVAGGDILSALRTYEEPDPVGDHGEL